LAQAYAYEGRVDEILNDRRLADVIDAQPDLKLLTAAALVRAGRKTEAEAAARQVTEYYRRQLDADRDNVELRRQLCEVYAILGNEIALISVLKQGVTLQPDGPWGPQLAELAVVRAIQLGESSTAPKSEKSAARREAVELLDRYGRGTGRAQALAGQLARIDGNWKDAERRYREAVAEIPAVHIELADLMLQSGRADEARQEWEAFLNFCQAKVDSGQTVDDGERQLAASAARELGRIEEADRWLADATQTSDIKATWVALYTARWDDARAKDPEQSHIELLEQGLKIDPWSPALLSRILTLARAEGTDGDQARAELRRMIAGGDMPGTAYLLLGTDAFERGDRRTALRYLEQAERLNPESAVVLNNLAWTLLHAESSELQRALSAADAAVSLGPRNIQFRDTRFRILAKMERWQQALSDLEFCAAGMKGDAGFHRAAAQVYDHLKLPDLAAEHRRLAE
jgi:tetratricopeptide (TPR) repeat protein